MHDRGRTKHLMSQSRVGEERIPTSIFIRMVRSAILLAILQNARLQRCRVALSTLRTPPLEVSSGLALHSVPQGARKTYNCDSQVIALFRVLERISRSFLRPRKHPFRWGRGLAGDYLIGDERHCAMDWARGRVRWGLCRWRRGLRGVTHTEGGIWGYPQM